MAPRLRQRTRQRRGHARLAAAVLAALVAYRLPAAAEPGVFPTGTTRYDPALADHSYVLFSGGDRVTRLIDLDGKVVHEWKLEGSPPVLIDPALAGGERGHLLVTLELGDGDGTGLVPGRAARRIVKTVGEVDWDGRTVWQFGPKAPGGYALQHHDLGRLRNGNTLVLANRVHPVAGFQQARIEDDVIYEVDPSGAVVWTWAASDHLDEFGFTGAELALVKASRSPDYLHVNNLKVVGPNHWFDAGDKRFDPDNLIFDSRNANFIAIIDRRSGRIVWTLGPHYPPVADGPEGRRVPRPVDQISGQHDAHIIPAGLPGAGNLLVFDNQGEGGYPAAPLTVTGGSRVLEIDPVTKQVVWQYTAEDSGRPSWSFRSAHISSARRLPNGNTLIDEGEVGRFFQVTAKGQIVWEYVNPYPSRIKDPVSGAELVNYQVYRAQPVPYAWVPDGTPRSQTPVVPPEPAQFHLPVLE